MQQALGSPAGGKKGAGGGAWASSAPGRSSLAVLGAPQAPATPASSSSSSSSSSSGSGSVDALTMASFDARLNQITALMSTIVSHIGERKVARGDGSTGDIASAVASMAAASSPAVPRAPQPTPSIFSSLAAAVPRGSGHPVPIARSPATRGDDHDDAQLDVRIDGDDGFDDPLGDRSKPSASAALAAIDAPQAPAALAKIRAAYGSWTAWLQRRDITGRSWHELRALTAALDHLLIDVPASHPGIEVLVRRVNALDAVESGKSWSVARAIEGEVDDSLLPRAALRSALRDAALADRLEQEGREATPKSKASGSSPSWQGGTGSSAPGGPGGWGQRGGRGGRGRGGRGGGQAQRGSSSTASGRGGAAPVA